jgi:hypothetical protein
LGLIDKLRATPIAYSTRPESGSPRSYDPITRERVSAASAQFNPDKSDAVTRNVSLLFAELAGADRDPNEELEYQLLDAIRKYKTMVEPEQEQVRALFRRFDRLYNPKDFTLGGADHWADEAKPGRTHISVNLHRAYVDLPAQLQATAPVENIIPQEQTKDARDAAAAAERLYFRWLDEDDREVKDEIACQIKALYGWTFGKVYWDSVRKMPTLQIIQSPENLYVGYGASDYTRIDWVIYCYALTPEAIEEDFGLGVDALPSADRNAFIPYVLPASHDDPLGTAGNISRLSAPGRRTAYDDLMVEVYDFWYRKPTGKGKKPEIWNAIYVGNRLVENAQHKEYDDIPYIPLRNGNVPGSPYAPGELYDIEQLLREKDERLSEQAAMIHSIVGGQRYQLVGPDAPDEVPANALPGPNGMAAPGAGNRIEPITPFIPEYAIEDYQKRIDRELEVVSGLNELILGTVPTNSLNSSKAISALTANYEARIARKRKLLYRFRREVWEMAAKVWERKDKSVARIIDGHYRLEIKAPELTPRDDLETAQRAINLVQNRIWSAVRAADATGVEDPEAEMDLIREEQTDASLNPAAVLQQTQLMAGLQQLGVGANPQNQEQLAATARQGANNQRTANPPAKGSASNNGSENAANPPGSSQPGNTPEGAASGAGGALTSQTLLGPDGLTGRILTQQKL